MKRRNHIEWWILGAAFVLTVCGTVSNGWAQVPEGDVFVVNQEATKWAISPSAAMNAEGTVLIAWTDSSGFDGDSNGVVARMYPADPSWPSREFVVNRRRRGAQYSPSVVPTRDGEFVVAWESRRSGAASSIDTELFGRAVSAVGEPVGPDLMINHIYWGWQRDVSLASDAEGNFVAVWAGPSYFGGRFRWSSVVGRQFNADGTAVYNEFGIAGASGASVARAPDGRFLVVWSARDADRSSGVYGRLFANDASPEGPRFLISQTKKGHKKRIVAAAGPDGDFLVAWDATGRSGWSELLYSRVVRSDGTLAREFRLARMKRRTGLYLGVPAVTGLANGLYAVAWEHYLQHPREPIAYVRLLDEDGTPAPRAVRFGSHNVAARTFWDRSLTIASGGGNEIVVAAERKTFDPTIPAWTRPHIAARRFRVPEPQSVEIDVVPGSDANVIRQRRGAFFVAVMGTETFDVRKLVRKSIAFGPGEAAPRRMRFRDMNGDGIADALLRFGARRVRCEPSDTTVKLTAWTRTGGRITGSDTIRCVR